MHIFISMFAPCYRRPTDKMRGLPISWLNHQQWFYKVGSYRHLEREVCSEQLWKGQSTYRFTWRGGVSNTVRDVSASANLVYFGDTHAHTLHKAVPAEAYFSPDSHIHTPQNPHTFTHTKELWAPLYPPHSPDPPHIPPALAWPPLYFPHSPDPPSTSPTRLTDSSGQVKRQLERLRHNKAAGPKGISPRVLKAFADQLCGILQHFFRKRFWCCGRHPMMAGEARGRRTGTQKQTQ